MIALSILALVAIAGVFCWLLFTFAVFALPAFVGVTAGVAAHDAGAGVIGATLAGAAAAVATLAIGHLLIAFSRPTWVKLLVAATFIIPAAVAGFHATYGVLHYFAALEGWRTAFALVGAVATGCAAHARVANPAGVGVSSGGLRA